MTINIRDFRRSTAPNNDKLIAGASINTTRDAYRTKTGVIRAVANREQWRPKDGDNRGIEAIGFEQIAGLAHIEIDIAWLSGMCMAAARAKSRQATVGRGGVVVKFSGQRTFKAEEAGQ